MTVKTLNEAHDSHVVLGLKEFGVQPRLDVDVLLHDEPDTFNLFLLALAELQADKSSEAMSYFQIGGIHGLPNGKWDKVDGKKVMFKNATGSNSSGYCAHGTQTFPTWHRPYLSMLEQELFRKVIAIVEKYTEVSPERKKTYAEAALKFRLPYWDYHRARDYRAQFPGVVNRDENQTGTTFYPYDFCVPQILTLDTVKVKMWPDDKLQPLANPLSSFKFKQFAPDGIPDSDWKIRQFASGDPRRDQTARWPNVARGFDSSVQTLNCSVNELREDTIRMSLNFVENGAYNSYLSYSTASAPDAKDPLDGGSAVGSLEGVHGDYHMLIGGSGHMSSVLTAGFDPIFFLHHAQIDRWFAVWQAAHPNSWFAPPDPNREQQSWDKSTPKDPLLPFRHPEGNFWNSEQSRKTESFGYTYPDLIGSNTPADVRERFRNLYKWARRLVPGKMPGADVHPPENMKPLDLSGLHFFDGIDGFTKLREPLQPAPTLSKLTAQLPLVSFSLANAPESFVAKAEPIEVKPSSEKVSHEWYIDDIVQRLAANGSFSIIYLIGDFDQGLPIHELMLAPTFSGINHVFAAPIEACDNCGFQEQQAHLVTSTSPITSMLLDYVETGYLESMRAEHVKPFLVKNLKWRAVTVDGVQLDPRVLARDNEYRISISSKTAPLPGEDGEVVYATYPEITADIIANGS